MKHLLPAPAPLVLATLATAAAASIIQTQINLAALDALGASVTPLARLVTTLEDLARFGPVMSAIGAAALVPALGAAHAAARGMAARGRMLLLALAGAAGLWAAFMLLGLVTPMPALVEATATPGGMAALCLAGALGGTLYARMTSGGARVAWHWSAAVLIAPLLFALMAPRAGPDLARANPSSYQVATIAAGLKAPWSLAFLPDGRALVTEREGRLLAIGPAGTGAPVAIAGLPPVLSQGGAPLMAVVVDPAFERNRLLYLTMGYGRPGANGTRLVRARLDGARLVEVRVLFDSTPKAHASNNGGALAFLPDGTLVLSVGDGQRREQAQDLSDHLGKLVRVDREGRAPADNPFAGASGAAFGLYTLGHRNAQGLAFDRFTASLLLSEHGPRGGDEINRIEAGKNYGWPLATGGIDYSFARVTPLHRMEGTVQPMVDWTPSIAPAGLAVYDGTLFAGWRGDLLVPALKERALRRVRRAQGRVVGQELLLAELGERMRDVKVAPDGSIYVLTDGLAARLLRLSPAPPTSASPASSMAAPAGSGTGEVGLK